MALNVAHGIVPVSMEFMHVLCSALNANIHKHMSAIQQS
jgi:hypothetical protein